jgi:hypothetical protein
MAKIAQEMIIINSVSDAYSVSLSPSSCVIKADYDGANPDLDYATATIRVFCGEEAVDFTAEVSEVSDDKLEYVLEQVNNTTMSLQLIDISSEEQSGSITLSISANGGEYNTSVTYQYTVVRETSMLDWILEWNSSATTISGQYVITPKLFAGKKETTEEGSETITGVYMGPSFRDESNYGLFGYKQFEEIFRLDANGGMIGGWVIDNNKIATSDGSLQLLSSGAISAQPDGETAWQLNSDGSAVFAKDKVHFNADGSADFEGTITAAAGKIGSWSINDKALYGKGILLDGEAQYIGVTNISAILGDDVGATVEAFKSNTALHGGVAMFYESGTSYGLEGYKVQDTNKGSNLQMPQVVKVFSLGSTNSIAGWNFDDNSLYIGIKKNTAQSTTSAEGSITIGTNGIRGYKWYIDADGSFSFLGGAVQLGTDGGKLAGWDISQERISTETVALVSTSGYNGLYVTTGELGETVTDYRNTISSKGGIYIAADTDNTQLSGYNSVGKRVFCLNSNSEQTNVIAGWKFTDTAIYSGDTDTLDATGYTLSSNSIVLSASRLSGNYWSIASDGSGSFAAGNIAWKKNGSGSIAGGKISWNAEGDLSFDESVTMMWTDADSEIQSSADYASMLASSQMLYRDPEFSNEGYNGTDDYLGYSYLTFSYSDVKDYIASTGLTFRGTDITILNIAIVKADGTVNELWSGSVELSEEDIVEFVSAEILSGIAFDDDDTLRITLHGEGPVLQLYASDRVYLTGSSEDIGQLTTGMERQWVDNEEAPNSTSKAMQITDYYWTALGDYRLGGFTFKNPAKAKAKYLARIVANIPTNFAIEECSNNCTVNWVTSTKGTGDWEEYKCVITCDADGDGELDTVGNFALIPTQTVKGDSSLSIKLEIITISSSGIKKIMQIYQSVEWQVATATLYDVASSEKAVTTIDKNGIYTGTLSAEQIVSGTIDAKFINTEDMVAQNVLVGDSEGQHVSIDPTEKAIKIYDSENRLCSTFDGSYHDDLSDLIGTRDSGDIEINNASHEAISVAAVSGELSSTKSTTGTVELGEIYTPTSTEITLNQGYIYLYAHAASNSKTIISTTGAINGNNNTLVGGSTVVTTTHSASATIKITIATYSDAGHKKLLNTKTIYEQGVSASAGETNSNTYSVADNTIKTDSGGYHVIKLSYSVSSVSSGDTASLSWGYNDTTEVPITASYNTDTYTTCFFANGFVLGTRNDNYVMARRTSSGMTFMMENNGYGFSFSADGIKYKNKNGDWKYLE